MLKGKIMANDLATLEPVDVKSQPYVPTVSVQAPATKNLIQQTTDNYEQEFDQARINRDPVKAFELSVKAKGTPIGDAASHAATLYAQGAADFRKINDPVEKAGGIQTPEGRVEAAKIFYSTKDNPKYGSALLALLLGQKEAAYRALTGGMEIKKTILDNKGEQVQLVTNEVGDLISATDFKTGKLLTPQDMVKRQVGVYSSFENTLAYITAKDTAKINNDAWNASQKQNNAWSAYGQAIVPTIDRIKNIGSQSWFKELPSEVQSKLLEFGTRAIGSASSASRSSTGLEMIQRNATENKGLQISDQIASALGLGKDQGPWKWSVDGTRAVSTKDGISKSISDLAQASNTISGQNELSSQFKQTQEQLATYLKTYKLPPEQQAQVMDFFKTSNDLGNSLLEMTKNHGLPAYLYLPGQLSSVDQKSRLQAQAEQLSLIPTLTANFGEYARGLKQAASEGNLIPSPYEAEKGYAKTDFYQSAIKQTKDKMNAIIMSAPEVRQETPSKTSAVKPPAVNKSTIAKPPVSSIPEGSVPYKKDKKTGQTVYKAPDGSLHW